MARIKAAFVASSALRAQRLGFELIELHAAHGHSAAPAFAAQQPAPRRVRRFAGEPNALSAEVFRAIREAVAHTMAVGVRLSATDFGRGGWDCEQSIAFSQQPETLGQ